MAAILKASKWLDDFDNRAQAAEVVGAEKYINAPAAEIAGRLAGVYDLGADLGEKDFKGEQMRFFRDGAVNFPRKSHYIWAMAQYQRFGLPRRGAAVPGAGRRADPHRPLQGGGGGRGHRRARRRHGAVRGQARQRDVRSRQSRRGGGPRMTEARCTDRASSRAASGGAAALGRRRPVARCRAPPARDPRGSCSGARRGSRSLVAVWQLGASRVAKLPAPGETFTKLRELLSEPFYDRGTERQGHRAADVRVAAARVHRVRPGRGGRGPARARDRREQAGMADVQPGDPAAAARVAAGVVPDLAGRVLRQRAGPPSG